VKLEPRVFNFSGPYAVGKDTIINSVLSHFGERAYRVSTWTTRSVDPDIDPSYTHIDREDLGKLQANSRWLVNYQLGGTTGYGTSLDEIEQCLRRGKLCIHSIYAGREGAGALRAYFGPRLYSFGIVPCGGKLEDQVAELDRRLRSRNRDEPNLLEARILHQAEPLSYISANESVSTEDREMPVFDHILTNEDIAVTTAEAIRLIENALHYDTAKE